MSSIKQRSEARHMQVYGPPDSYPCTPQHWGPEQVKAYLMARYGDVNPDKNRVIKKSIDTYTLGAQRRKQSR